MAILSDPDIRETFEDAWINAPASVRAYKGWDDLEPLVSNACRRSAITAL